MKRSVVTLFVFLALAVPLSGLAQIPNPGFETWTGTTTLLPTGWITNNIPGLAVGITRSTTAHTGTYSIQGAVVNFANQVSWAPSLNSFFPYTQRPGSLTGYYRLTSVAHDSLFVIVWMYKGSMSTYVAVGSFFTNVGTSQWTKFTAPLQYVSGLAPDTAWIEITAGGGDNDSVHVGTTFLLDDLAFEGTATGVREQELKPTSFALRQNYPNPFNPSTVIQYDLPKAAYVRLSVYNLIGQEVAALVDDQQQAGAYEVRFNALNLPSGTYFYRIQAGDYVDVKKMTFVR
jgi:hypothetical protein